MISKCIYQIEHLKLKYTRRPIYYVFSPGKTATSTYVKTLRSAGGKAQGAVYDGKFRSPDLKGLIDRYSGGPYSSRNKLKKNIKNHALHDFISKRAKGVKVIVGIREPISLHVSGVFQQIERNRNIREYTSSQIAEYINQSLMINPADNIDCIDYPSIEQELYYPFKWFRFCYEGLFGVSPFSANFDKANGYGFWNDENLTIYLVTKESDRTVKQRVINQVLQSSEYPLTDKNVASEKWYTDLYQEVKGKVVVPPKVARSIRESEYMQFFYGDAKAQSLIYRWPIKGS